MRFAMRYASKDDYLAVCPADIFFGREHNKRLEYKEELHLFEDQKVLVHTPTSRPSSTPGQSSHLVRLWWIWSQTRSTWKQKYRFVKVGDMGHIIYKGNIDSRSDCYRLCQVNKVFPDMQGNVRTCTIQFRPRQVTDTSRG